MNPPPDKIHREELSIKERKTSPDNMTLSIIKDRHNNKENNAMDLSISTPCAKTKLRKSVSSEEGRMFISNSQDTHPVSALHRLAEVAERKQMEEEMMDCDGSAHPESPAVVKKEPLHRTESSLRSPESDVLSSYYSLKECPQLSRNNSDASQYSSESPNQSPGPLRNEFHINGEEFSSTEIASLSNNISAAAAGVSRQQLINSPCPVCSDKISGFHYGIFSCESCKGFFKRTVQNKKNYVCLRGSQCPVRISTRKKCPACRFEKCLRTGMKLEAIREDRTRGGRSRYQCSYTLPEGLCSSNSPAMKQEDSLLDNSPDEDIPLLLREIMSVEHLWFGNGRSNDNERLEDSPNLVQTLTFLADKRLYKLVKWCKSLPLFKNILIDDQITLLINAWCELLVFSCCYRSVDSPGKIRLTRDKTLDLKSSKIFGMQNCIEKMLNFSEQLRRLKVDHYEYVAMKVIVLLTSDASGLKEVERVRESQEKVVQALQRYTTLHYPSMPTKFGELLLRTPELQRVCQVGKEMLCPRQSTGGETPGFNLLMELLRGDH